MPIKLANTGLEISNLPRKIYIIREDCENNKHYGGNYGDNEAFFGGIIFSS